MTKIPLLTLNMNAVYYVIAMWKDAMLRKSHAEWLYLYKMSGTGNRIEPGGALVVAKGVGGLVKPQVVSVGFLSDMVKVF